MRKLFLKLSFMIGLCLLLTVDQASGDATKTEAVQWVKQAIAYYKKHGLKTSLQVFNDPKGEFVKGDLYVIVCTFEGVFLAHGVSKGLVGQNLHDLKDLEGVFIIQEMIKSAQQNPAGGWAYYLWINPANKKLSRKATYVEVYDDLLFMTGAYDPF